MRRSWWGWTGPLGLGVAVFVTLGGGLLRPVPAADQAGLPRAAHAATGRIEGQATLSPRLTTRRLRVRVYAEPGARPAAAEPDSNPFATVVLYLEAAPPAPAGRQAPAPPIMSQRGEQFRPHVLPVVVGTTVAFPNDDPIYHNVFSLASARTFDLGRYRKGQSKSVVFPSPGVVPVFCHIHADMSAYILVVDHPYFTVPNASGRFTIDDVPAGDYRLVAWHERIRPITIPVRVESGRAAVVDVSLPLAEPAGAR